MSTGNKVLAVNRHEKKILDAIEIGYYKLKSIQEYTGFNFPTTVHYLRNFRESDVILYDQKLNTYKLAKGLKYKLCEQRKEEPVVVVNPIAPTFKNRLTYDKVHGDVTITRLTPEEMLECERKSNQHQPFLEFKRGELIPNENYNHAKHSR